MTLLNVTLGSNSRITRKKSFINAAVIPEVWRRGQLDSDKCMLIQLAVEYDKDKTKVSCSNAKKLKMEKKLD